MYLALKLLHLLAVMLFLGNIITGVFWKAHADRTRDPRLIAHTMAGIIGSDRWFTNPGVVLLVVFGLGAAMTGGVPILRTPWIWQSIVLLTISGAAYGMRLAPLQRQMHRLAAAASEGGAFDEPRYEQLSRQWGIWGLVATLAPLAAFALMIFKPAH